MSIRSILSLATLVAAAAACGGASVPSDPSTPGPSASSPTSTASPAPEEAFQVWMTKDGRLHLTWGVGPADDALRLAMEQLVEGPADGAAGVRSAIPPGTALRDVINNAGLVMVDLSEEFGREGGGPSRILSLAQLVYTATQFEGVGGVMVRVEGSPVEAIDQRGRRVDHALGRDDYDDLLPAIVVEEPAAGAAVSSPVTVSGTANVFEATVSIRILGPDRSPIAETFTTATCGTGCRGDYAAEVEFDVDEVQEGTIEVFEASGETGEPINVVSVPVTLQP